MINRRHIRIKVMQAIYALLLSENDNLDSQERYLLQSIERLHDLYFLEYFLFVALWEKANKHFDASKNKYIHTGSPMETSPNFVKNRVLGSIRKSLLDMDISSKNIPDWNEHSEVVNMVWDKLITTKDFATYMALPETDFKQDKQFLIDIFKRFIAPNENLAEFYESEVISWVDDIPFVNTWVLDNLKKLSETKKFQLDRLYKDMEDRDFAKQLFRKVVLHFNKYEEVIDKKTPNWDAERITKVDKLLIAMGITEFLHFPSIPTKVTINEYIEIAKDYATPKSGLFINGVLDKLLDDYKADNSIQKTGRGLL